MSKQRTESGSAKPKEVRSALPTGAREEGFIKRQKQSKEVDGP